MRRGCLLKALQMLIHEMGGPVSNTVKHGCQKFIREMYPEKCGTILKIKVLRRFFTDSK